MKKVKCTKCGGNCYKRFSNFLDSKGDIQYELVCFKCDNIVLIKNED